MFHFNHWPVVLEPACATTTPLGFIKLCYTHLEVTNVQHAALEGPNVYKMGPSRSKKRHHNSDLLQSTTRPKPLSSFLHYSVTQTQCNSKSHQLSSLLASLVQSSHRPASPVSLPHRLLPISHRRPQFLSHPLLPSSSVVKSTLTVPTDRSVNTTFVSRPPPAVHLPQFPLLPSSSDA